ncbi:MAG TPA: tricarballylate utilization 4Fe-4S protein TcuB [Candidatus Methylomirabilis sp.]|nr:tricarballylate utilization 4Fe-4S protein TcuB [Candidatus Methylomirabilis sp.]
MSAAKSIPLELIQQGEWFMRICNACRYCEGYCPVFPALERRLTFEEGDLNYLANLCHNCGSCYDACQYAPPHEFALNFPKILAEIRGETYKKYAWPGFLAGLFRRNGLAVSLITGAGLAVFLLSLTVFVGPAVLLSAHDLRQGSFYAVLGHDAMALIFSLVSLLVVSAFVVGCVRFWRDMGESFDAILNPMALGRAAMDVLRLKHLDGGGEGCIYPDEEPTLVRRRFHHLTFYGFLLCFASTTVAAFYDYVLRWPAPYAFWSLPVLLGTLGGLGLLIGPAGLLWLKGKRNPVLSDQNQTGMDIGFLTLLFLTSLTGLLLLVLRETPAMGVLLAVHLGLILGLFVTMPYGKFVHAIYRAAALVRYAIEESRPTPKFGSD